MIGVHEKETDKIIDLKNISKVFPGVRALQDVDFHVEPEEIVGLVGENGAGKSTLMKILIGLYKQDTGTYVLRGECAKIENPWDAVQKGIGMVYQEGSLLPNITVAENLFLGYENRFTKNGIISNKKVISEAEDQLDLVGSQVNPKAFVSDISQAKRQLIEVARLLWLSKISGCKNPVLILDEPTTVLLSHEIEKLFNTMIALKKEASIIFISHRLEEILEISDRIVIFKDGKSVSEFKNKSVEIKTIEQMMVGRELAEDHYLVNEQREPEKKCILEIENLQNENTYKNVSFNLMKGEILSLVGVLGSGKEELCRTIAGIEKYEQGSIKKNGKKININNPGDAIRNGIGYIPIDRRDEGLALQLDVNMNISVLSLKKFIKKGFINQREEKDATYYWIENLNIKTPSIKTSCLNLSGGNQQKILISRWLSTSIDVLILDHPTRGIDVGAKEEIYRRIRLLANEGLSILLMSDTLEEDIGLSNRMIILKDGVLTKVIECPKENKPTAASIIQYMV